MTLTESAIEKLKEIIAEESNPNIKLRVFVQGGGCAGLAMDLHWTKKPMKMIGIRTMAACVCWLIQ